MASDTGMAANPLWRGMRWVVWGGAGLLLLAPWVAMRFTAEVHWTALDFAVMGTLLGLVGVAFEVVLRHAGSHAYVLAAGLAVGTAFLTTWANLAVGIIGDAGHPANWLFHGVILVALAGAALARMRPAGLVRAMQATAAVQALAGAVALAVARDQPEGAVASLVFAALWWASALLFRHAARRVRA